MSNVVSNSLFRIVHQSNEGYTAMGTAQEPRERALRNPVVVGHVRVYNPVSGEQRNAELIASAARELAGQSEFYFCTHWEGRIGEASRYWRVITDNA